MAALAGLSKQLHHHFFLSGSSRCLASVVGSVNASRAPEILAELPGYVVVNKPHGLSLRSLVAWIRQTFPDLKGMALSQTQGQLEAASSGAVLVATSRRTALAVRELRERHRFAELYTAIVRGRLMLRDTIRIERRLCQPSEGSSAWRIAGRRIEGREACTLIRGLYHGHFNGEPCTLVKMRPVTTCRQQLRLHCVAIGHPIVGDVLHEADRRLDFCFERPVEAPRLMLHCVQLRVPSIERPVDRDADITASDTLTPMLDVGSITPDAQCAQDEQDSMSLMSDAAVAGSTRKLRALDCWDSFAGGLADGILDDSHWDSHPNPRRSPGPPFGPADWDERTRRFEQRAAGENG